MPEEPLEGTSSNLHPAGEQSGESEDSTMMETQGRAHGKKKMKKSTVKRLGGTLRRPAGPTGKVPQVTTKNRSSALRKDWGSRAEDSDDVQELSLSEEEHNMDVSRETDSGMTPPSVTVKSPEDAASLTRTPPAKGPTVTCDHDRGCGRGLFCDRHFGLCVALRQDGQYCRKDSHCARGLGCMFGRCQRTIPGGHEGSRCRHDKDCGPSMCCARHHGETICQRRLPAGHSCFIPEGGLAFSLNQRCPCEEGLTCSAAPPPREKEFDYSPGAAWKCLSPSP
ncbi:uncharacterized protein LOC142473207 [Ascaphus truei]|uniref:uncharacterized protein LOC142473207 n=1 Tax=Ascaphus truei TaxID=8439 RepID=UPI003F5A2AB7